MKLVYVRCVWSCYVAHNVILEEHKRPLVLSCRFEKKDLKLIPGLALALALPLLLPSDLL